MNSSKEFHDHHQLCRHCAVVGMWGKIFLFVCGDGGMCPIHPAFVRVMASVFY